MEPITVFTAFLLFCLPTLLDGRTYNTPISTTIQPPPLQLLNVSEVIAYYGYVPENHEVKTEDGYILPVTRILNKPGPPVLLVQGFGIGSEIWLVNGPQAGIGFLLSNMGYDVWLGRQRGLHGTSHVSLNSTQSEFWDFSHDESGYYDLPAMMDLILSKSSYKKIFYGGTSLGSTFYMVLCSERPEYESLFAGSMHFAPAMWISPFDQFDDGIKFLLTSLKFLVRILDLFGNAHALLANPGFKNLLRDLCDRPLAQDFCLMLLKPIGLQKRNVALDWFGYSVAECSSGTSLRTLAHLIQLTRRGGAEKYDWGPEKNLKKYNALHPPSYNLTKISSPTAVYYSKIDKLVRLPAMKVALSKIGNLKHAMEPDDPSYGHVEFVFGKDLYKYVFKDAINFLDSISGIRNSSVN